MLDLTTAHGEAAKDRINAEVITDYNEDKWTQNFDEKRNRGGGFFTGTTFCDTDQSGTLQSAAAVTLTSRYW